MADLIFNNGSSSMSMSIDDTLVTDDVRTFADLCFDAVDLYAKKNHDYGNSFNKGMEAIGDAYGVGRIFDKVNRLVSLCNKEDKPQVDESYDDTLMDLACYSIMTLAYRKLNKVKKINSIKFD